MPINIMVFGNVWTQKEIKIIQKKFLKIRSFNLLKNHILIIGGTGFIGFHLAKKCLSKNWKVYSISSRPPSKTRYLKKVKYIIADISNFKSLKKKIKRNFTYIVNLGGHVEHANKTKTYTTHYLGCKNIFNVFKENMPAKFIQMGSSSEYGFRKSPHKENLNCISKTKQNI